MALAVSFSPPPTVLTSTQPLSSVDMYMPPTPELPHPQSVHNGPDSGTLEQAAASIFGTHPDPSAHGTIPPTAHGLAPAPPLPDPKYPSAPHGGAPLYLQPIGTPYGGTGSMYPPAQAQFYPPHPYQYEFHYHTPPQATFCATQPRQDGPSSQPPSQLQQSPSVQRRQSDSFRAATPAQQMSPPNPTLTYDAFWSSHSLSAHSYRNAMFTMPGPTYQGQMNGAYALANPQPGVVEVSPSVSTPMAITGPPEMAGAPAHATQSAHTS